MKPDPTLTQRIQSAAPTDFAGCWWMEPTRFRVLMEDIRVGGPEQSAGRMSNGPSGTMQLFPGKAGKSVAVIHAKNVLMKPTSYFGTSTVQLRRDIRQAAGDPDISGILLAIDSPGGTVAGMHALLTDVNAARRKKPVWSHIDDIGASAAYALASQTDAIYATGPDTVLGSIGTLFAVYDMSAMAEKAGVKALIFKTGPLKAAGYPGTPVTDEQQAYFQKFVDDSQQNFDAAVRKGRGMNQTELTAVRDGGVFLAPVAVGLKLIDGVQSADKTLADLAAAK